MHTNAINNLLMELTAKNVKILTLKFFFQAQLSSLKPQLKLSFSFRKRLLTGTLLVNNSLLTGTVPANKSLSTGTFQVDESL